MSLRAEPIDREVASILSPVAIEDGIPLEIYRQLFALLELSPDNHPVIGVTSSIVGEGRTTIALELARTLAHDLDCMVSLIEADLERPSLAQHFGVTPGAGLAEVLRGEERLTDVRQHITSNFCLVTSGSGSADAAGLLRQLHTSDPFHGLQRLPGVSILDLPPILGQGYSALASRAADAVILVVRAGVTPVEVVREALASLDDRLPAGVVFNDARSLLPSWWPERVL